MAMGAATARFALGLALALAGSVVAGVEVHGVVQGPDGPLAGATVTAVVDQQPAVSTVTASDGRYRLTLNPGGLRLTASLPGSALLGVPIEHFGLGEDRELRLYMAPAVEVRFRAELPPELNADQLWVALTSLDRNHSFTWWFPERTDGTYRVTVPAGRYAIRVYPCMDRPPVCTNDGYSAWLPVDASAGDVANLVVPRVQPGHFTLPRRPPRIDLIEVGPADADGIAIVRGQPGAASGVARISAMNLHTGQYNGTSAQADGSFALDLFAPEGSWISVHEDPTGQATSPSLAAGTMLRAPMRSSDDLLAIVRAGASFEADGGEVRSVGVRDGGQLWMRASLPQRQFAAGNTIDLVGDYVLYSRAFASSEPNPAHLRIRAFLERVVGADGRQEVAAPEFVSSVLTPTGFPIERATSYLSQGVDLGPVTMGAPQARSRFSRQGSWQARLPLPATLPAGAYQVVLVPDYGFQLPPSDRQFAGVYNTVFDTLFSEAVAGLIEVGTIPPRRTGWALGLNDLSNGSRGVVAVEDESYLQIAGHVSSQSQKFILPLADERTGQRKRYSLEPFAPLTSVSNRGWPPPPSIPFRFPSGQYRVSITTPDGNTREIGSAPFRQAFLQGIGARGGGRISGVSNRPEQYFGLTTLDPRFEIEFEQYGLHWIHAEGTLQDQHGNVYQGGGRYPYYIARTLDLETGVFPNTPFTVGDRFSPSLVVQPGVAAEVTVELTHLPYSDPVRRQHRVFHGRANRFGYFHPQREIPFVFEQPGEYRVDYTARFTDERGVLWMGSQSWGSVVATPGSPIITHGKRGFETQGGAAQQWLLVRRTPNNSTHLHYPFHSGDVVWMDDLGSDPTFTAHTPRISLQDADGWLANRLRQRPEYHRLGAINELIERGEIPLLSTTPSQLPAPLEADLPSTDWAYFYAGSARPGVRIREMVSEDNASNGYWRFDDHYNYQLGNGANGDLPNDFKFQFGGAVYRAPAANFTYYGAYGSLWVLLPSDDADGGRVMPPFQGAAGGPSGGPIMTLKGRDIDIFLHPMGVRPGSILQRGDVAAFSGQIGPTLPSKVSWLITAPSGAQRRIEGLANAVGYYYDPSSNFSIDETGVYRVAVQVWHDGLTSAGPVAAPFPSGSVLGADAAGEFAFFAVERDAPAAGSSLAAESWVRPADGPLITTLQAPAGSTPVSLARSTSMPGFLLDYASGPSLSHRYDASALQQDFPNLDLYDNEGHSGVDTVTLSYLLSATGSRGQLRHLARQHLLQGEQWLAPAQRADDPIDREISGSWFNPAQSGHGLMLEVVDAGNAGALLTAYWYVYHEGKPVWLVGSTPVIDPKAVTLDLYIASGTGFPPNFNPAEVDLRPWGTATLHFESAERATLSWIATAAGFGSDQMSLQKIAPLATGQAGCRSGSYYDPAQNGQGFVVQVIDIGGAPHAVVAWYTFQAGEQLWLLGLGPLQQDLAEIPLSRYSGARFPPAFRSAEVTRETWGTLQIRFASAQQAEASWRAERPGFSDGRMTLTRLTSLAARSCP